MLKLFWNMMAPFLGFSQEGAAGGDSGSGGDAGGDAGSGGAAEDGASGGEGDPAGSDAGAAGAGSESGAAGGAASDDNKPDLSTPEGYLKFAQENGAFDSADKYTIPTEFEGVEIPEHLSSVWDVKSDAAMFAGMAAKHGLTQSQAEGVFKDYMTTALDMSTKAEAEALEAQKPEVILKEVYGDKAGEAKPMLERGLKALGIDASKGLRVTHAMKAIAEIGRLVGEDGNFHNGGGGPAEDEEMSTEAWLKAAMK